MPERKEPTYYAVCDGHDAAPGEERLRWPVRNRVDYLSLFDGVRGERAVGEASVMYLFFGNAPQAIARDRPNARLLALLRHPADRAYSSYLAYARDGLEPASSFEDALAQEQAGVRQGWPHGRHFHVGLYARHLARFDQYFPRDQIRVFLYDDFVQAPEKVLAGAFEFLKIDPDLEVEVTQNHAATGVIENPFGRALWNVAEPLRRGLRDHVPLRWRNKARGLMGSETRPILSPDTKARLIEQYREDIVALAERLERDLSHWLDPAHVAGFR